MPKKTNLSDKLVICTPAPLSDDQVAQLADKAGQPVEIKIDPSLIGGAALSINGLYKDYSLKAKFAENEDILKGIYEQFVQNRRSRVCPEC
ncbi:MAG: F0F1 ATP synthase subunit delta [Patescibacteria group bacterium]|nr:F0F1 ATP synthase subunit delta [Patescibacteria group bacterium]MCL5432288.1 F0F1 ATP synthase subunit delta [Patescibacteria group bacterium]